MLEEIISAIIKEPTVVNISLVIAIMGFVSFYFGKLISENQPHKEVREVNYVNGISFLIVFFIVPLLIIIAIKEQTILNLTFLTAGLLLLQFITMLYLKSRWTKNMNSIIKGKLDTFTIRDRIILIFISLFNLATILIIDGESVALLYKVFSFVLFFIIISWCAILYGAIDAKRLEAIIHFKDRRKPMKGTLLKIEEGFIDILSEEKIYNILSKGVLYIERINDIKTNVNQQVMQTITNIGNATKEPRWPDLTCSLPEDEDIVKCGDKLRRDDIDGSD